MKRERKDSIHRKLQTEQIRGGGTSTSIYPARRGKGTKEDPRNKKKLKLLSFTTSICCTKESSNHRRSQTKFAVLPHQTRGGGIGERITREGNANISKKGSKDSKGKKGGEKENSPEDKGEKRPTHPEFHRQRKFPR